MKWEDLLPGGYAAAIGHRNPRYVCNRARQAVFERIHPDAPWVTPAAVRLLAGILRPSDRGVEFGSGRSTSWFAARVGHLTSVEHDREWYATVAARLKRQGLGNVDYILAPRDQPEDRGDRSEYLQAVAGIGAESIDFAMIDGMYRGYAAQLVMPKIRPGGLMIIDNVNWYLPSRSHAPNSRSLAAGPAGPVWQEVARDLAQWRTIWTSSGVWDTALFIKA
jgi:predicted O-methyltransferase YrrM